MPNLTETIASQKNPHFPLMGAVIALPSFYAFLWLVAKLYSSVS
jgi:hypothetical protein